MNRKFNISIVSFFSKGHRRDLLIKKNIAASFLIKLCTVVITFISYPLTLNYLNPTRSGIWLALTSIISWILILDIGLGNGLKNKLAEALAKKDLREGKSYVSSTYALLGILLLLFMAVFIAISPYLDWTLFLNTPPSYKDELNALSQVVFCGFCCSFFLRLLISIINADQRPALGALIDMFSQLGCLIGIIILSKTSNGSLINFGWISAAIPVVVYTFASIILFRKKYREISPSINYINWNHAKRMIHLGTKFFVATLSSLVLFQTASILISRIISNEAVTVYNTSMKVFSIGYNILSIIIYPYWVAYSDAFVLKDYQWMQRSYKKLLQIFCWFIIIEILLLVVSGWFYIFWIKEIITIPSSVSLSVFIFVCSLGWISILIYPINGTGKIKLQFYCSIYEMLALIPLAICLGNCIGIEGIILAPLIVSLPRMIWAPIQLHKLSNGTAKGIWNQ